jgi:hypothetical protein
MSLIVTRIGIGRIFDFIGTGMENFLSKQVLIRMSGYNEWDRKVKEMEILSVPLLERIGLMVTGNKYRIKF